MNALLLTLALAPAAEPDPADWKAAEAAHLKNVRQLTTDYVRAGEGYFSPDATKIIFQAEEKGTGNPFYQIFIMDLRTGKATRISPGVGRTTCGYFRPDGKKVLFASSHSDPDARKHQEAEVRQREEDRKNGVRRRYSWDFDPHMKIYEADLDGTGLKCLTPDAKVYTAEGSYSADGKRIVYSAGNAGNVQLFTMRADGTDVKRLTDVANCYNGGPFFSPDGTKVVFRADRKEKDRLQLYVINADGTGEKALTSDDKWVYWAPYWYKDSRHIIYTGADHSNPVAPPNYDLHWMDTATGKRTRVTFAPGQDVLPVFSPDGTKVMWTSSREGGRGAQLYIADFTPPK
ncbi:biopolymer transporter Tol [Gemmata sp. JC717]|uniref:Biopolymer transporter Tol n=1 Tax=Gemmata algarum TaxID=2975278 RepID=A0ABU5F4S7_9BACT|nr:biopolymer transporter Tol [Gemmata algarum]MDY3552755.1 biopolymer transporter Tol [Gemmata algarum]MDY3562148.1 biopolymer transporter Tol [Gemmata algarum]